MLGNSMNRSSDIHLHPNTVLQTNVEMDNLLQVHRRKMLRRAANRKSAQLSRARKKAHMEDLKIENARLQKVVDILESQPELLFCITIDGKVTYIAERTLAFIKSALPNCFTDEEPTHINQILSNDSVEIVLKTVSQISESENSENEINSLSSCKEVCFRDSAKYLANGYLRCSRVIRSSENEESFYANMTNENMDSEGQKSSKKPKKIIPKSQSINLGVDSLIKEAPEEDRTTSIANAVAALSSLSYMQYPVIAAPSTMTYVANSVSSSSTSGSNQSNAKKFMSQSKRKMIQQDESNYDSDNDDSCNGIVIMPSDMSYEPEFVCVIRPAAVSVPSNTSLSSASVAAHNFGSKNKYSHSDDHILNRPGSPNSSLSSTLSSYNTNPSENGSNTTDSSNNGGTSSESSSGSEESS